MVEFGSRRISAVRVGIRVAANSRPGEKWSFDPRSVKAQHPTSLLPVDDNVARQGSEAGIKNIVHRNKNFTDAVIREKVIGLTDSHELRNFDALGKNVVKTLLPEVTNKN